MKMRVRRQADAVWVEAAATRTSTRTRTHTRTPMDTMLLLFISMSILALSMNGSCYSMAFTLKPFSKHLNLDRHAELARTMRLGLRQRLSEGWGADAGALAAFKHEHAYEYEDMPPYTDVHAYGDAYEDVYQAHEQNATDIADSFKDWKHNTDQEQAGMIQLEYEAWCAWYGKTYDESRLTIFAGNYKQVEEYNHLTGSSTRLNEFADLTVEEFSQQQKQQQQQQWHKGMGVNIGTARRTATSGPTISGQLRQTSESGDGGALSSNSHSTQGMSNVRWRIPYQPTTRQQSFSSGLAKNEPTSTESVQALSVISLEIPHQTLSRQVSSRTDIIQNDPNTKTSIDNSVQALSAVQCHAPIKPNPGLSRQTYSSIGLNKQGLNADTASISSKPRHPGASDISNDHVWIGLADEEMPRGRSTEDVFALDLDVDDPDNYYFASSKPSKEDPAGKPTRSLLRSDERNPEYKDSTSEASDDINLGLADLQPSPTTSTTIDPAPLGNSPARKVSALHTRESNRSELSSTDVLTGKHTTTTSAKPADRSLEDFVQIDSQPQPSVAQAPGNIPEAFYRRNLKTVDGQSRIPQNIYARASIPESLLSLKTSQETRTTDSQTPSEMSSSVPSCCQASDEQLKKPQDERFLDNQVEGDSDRAESIVQVEASLEMSDNMDKATTETSSAQPDPPVKEMIVVGSTVTTKRAPQQRPTAPIVDAKISITLDPSEHTTILSAYKEWCSYYHKAFQPARLSAFTENYLQAQTYFKVTGMALALNEFADMTQGEYMNMIDKEEAMQQKIELKSSEEDRIRYEIEARLAVKKEAQRILDEDERINAEVEARIKQQAEVDRRAEEDARRLQQEATARIRAEAEAREREQIQICMAEYDANLKAKKEAQETQLAKTTSMAANSEEDIDAMRWMCDDEVLQIQEEPSQVTIDEPLDRAHILIQDKTDKGELQISKHEANYIDYEVGQHDAEVFPEHDEENARWGDVHETLQAYDEYAVLQSEDTDRVQASRTMKGAKEVADGGSKEGRILPEETNSLVADKNESNFQADLERILKAEIQAKREVEGEGKQSVHVGARSRRREELRLKAAIDVEWKANRPAQKHARMEAETGPTVQAQPKLDTEVSSAVQKEVNRKVDEEAQSEANQIVNESVMESKVNEPVMKWKEKETANLDAEVKVRHEYKQRTEPGSNQNFDETALQEVDMDAKDKTA